MSKLNRKQHLRTCRVSPSAGQGHCHSHLLSGCGKSALNRKQTDLEGGHFPEGEGDSSGLRIFQLPSQCLLVKSPSRAVQGFDSTVSPGRFQLGHKHGALAGSDPLLDLVTAKGESGVSDANDTTAVSSSADPP